MINNHTKNDPGKSGSTIGRSANTIQKYPKNKRKKYGIFTLVLSIL